MDGFLFQSFMISMLISIPLGGIILGMGEAKIRIWEIILITITILFMWFVVIGLYL